MIPPLARLAKGANFAYADVPLYHKDKWVR
jgi:hypothetical protein